MTGFDLAAYLARVALAEAPAADAAGLATLQRAHRLAIPFESLDVALGREIRVDSAGVFAKLVAARRGGYCFEHCRLLLDALAALGFSARPLLGRVWLDHPRDVPPLVHTLALVMIDGRNWIADAGFGGSYSPPMPLAEGEADGPDGARFRLARDPAFGWMLGRDGHPGLTDGRSPGAGWQDQYSFTLDPVHPGDIALGNFWVSHAPGTRFVENRIVSIPLADGFATLTNRHYRRQTGERTEEATVDDPGAYRQRLGRTFGIDLTMEEIAGLGLF